MGLKKMIDNPKKVEIMYEQTKILVKNKVQYLKIPCGECGKNTILIHIYKCLECGIMFCKECAKKHFE